MIFSELTKFAVIKKCMPIYSNDAPFESVGTFYMLQVCMQGNVLKNLEN